MPAVTEMQARVGAGRAVLVGPPPAGPAGTSIVAVPGGYVVVDPADPDGPLHAVLDDPGEALPAVAALFGPDVAETVADLAAGAAEGAADPRTVEVRPGPLDTAVRTVGLCRWLAHHSPDALPEALLDIEWGVTGTADELSDVTADEAAARLAARAADVVELARLLREPDLPAPPAGLAELVARAVEAAGEVVPLGDPVAAVLLHEQELTAALDRLDLPAGPRTWDDLAALPGIGSRALQGAIDMGPRDATTEQRGSVDWLLVPRGVLDTAEDTVVWTMRGHDLEVSVRAAATGPDHRGLAFRVYAPDLPLPVARAALRRSADGRTFTGRAGLRPGTPGPLVVDVYDTVHPRPARRGIAAEAARAVRWATRAVTLVRLGGVVPGTDAVAAEALAIAAGLYEEVGEEHPDPAERAWARRREARCAAVGQAVLRRGGRGREADRLGRRWRTAEEPVTTRDVDVPDLDGPGWRPLVAERAVAGAAEWRR